MLRTLASYPVSYTHLDVYKRHSEDRSIIQVLVILRRRFDNIYCHIQDLCMKYNRNIKHNDTIIYLGERVGVCECVRACVCIILYVMTYDSLLTCSSVHITCVYIALNI